MFNFIIPPLVTGIVFYFIYRIFDLFARRDERIMFINKMSDGIRPAGCPTYFDNRPSGRFSVLRAGCLLAGLGLGLLCAFTICSFAIPNFTTEGRYAGDVEIVTSVYGAGVLLFGGLGLLVAYAIEGKNGKHDKADTTDNGTPAGNA